MLTMADHESDNRIPRAAVPLPTQPPYTAHIANLAFDLTEPEVERYFEGCNVVRVRIMKDRIDNKSKGFGYVEFSDLESLKLAISLGDNQLAGRIIRVNVAEPRTTFPWQWRKANVAARTSLQQSDEASQGEWRSGKVLSTMESRPSGNSSGDGIVRNERRDMNLPSTESGLDKWERKGPLPPARETGERRSVSGTTPRSGSGQFGAGPSRHQSHDSPADVNEWRAFKPLVPVTPSEPGKCNFMVGINSLVTSQPALSTAGGSPAVQRKKLALLPRSEHAPESLSSPQAATDETQSTRTNAAGGARPVDTDSILKMLELKLEQEKLS